MHLQPQPEVDFLSILAGSNVALLFDLDGPTARRQGKAVAGDGKP